MKKFFLYFSGCLFTNTECLTTHKKPKKYPIILFIMMMISLLSPIQFSFINTSKESLVKDFPSIENAFVEVSNVLTNENIEVVIDKGELNYSKEYKGYHKNYLVSIGIEYEKYPEVKDEIGYKDNNLIIFGDKYFYTRYTSKEKGELKVKEITGSYQKLSHFSLNELKDSENSKAQVQGLIKAIYLTNSQYYALIWGFIIEIFNLIFILLASFVFLLCNNKGKRELKLTFGQSFLTMMSTVAMPALVAIIVGMFNSKLFTITYILLLLIKLLMMCLTQFSTNKNKYDEIVENH